MTEVSRRMRIVRDNEKDNDNGDDNDDDIDDFT